MVVAIRWEWASVKHQLRTTSDILKCKMMSLNHIGYARHKNDITNNKSHKSQPHQMNGQIITDWSSNIK